MSTHRQVFFASKVNPAGSKVAKDTSLLGGDSHALYSISRDGALFCWGYEHGSDERQARKRRKTRTGKLLSARSEENKAIADLTGSEEQVTVFSGTHAHSEVQKLKLLMLFQPRCDGKFGEHYRRHLGFRREALLQ